MPLFIITALCVSFGALFVGWSTLERRKTAPRLWLGFVATAIAVPLAYLAGAFVTSFESNLCYSQVIAAVQQQGSKVVALPLAGYETSCISLKQALGL